jgi:hypothetical protein
MISFPDPFAFRATVELQKPVAPCERVEQQILSGIKKGVWDHDGCLPSGRECLEKAARVSQ